METLTTEQERIDIAQALSQFTMNNPVDVCSVHRHGDGCVVLFKSEWYSTISKKMVSEPRVAYLQISGKQWRVSWSMIA